MKNSNKIHLAEFDNQWMNSTPSSFCDQTRKTKDLVEIDKEEDVVPARSQQKARIEEVIEENPVQHSLWTPYQVNFNDSFLSLLV